MFPRIVLDTCVLVAGLRSDRGASHRLLCAIGTQSFGLCLSVPLVFEYESVTKRQSRALGLTHAEIDDVIDYLCSVAELHTVHFLWRPVLRDVADDFVLELAVEAGCDAIVTNNVSDFAGADLFGIDILTPAAFLRKIGDLS